ncbi:PspC domain-containing protein [Bacillus chungangensis]|uniref:Phage shock protein PspC (Stress-responsive transcriptional regulator) n=1 Tax=Bacillus chungangensis TaxID=587633 RepID=A0ABT9WUK6_9BACI|nr:PspC domain-containing protein [Bacillus chungangensis]MDQ0176793.1 phage shock protein PspC (stress-responsive transcriptional regulator) [Bacillus chungangensis]
MEKKLTKSKKDRYLLGVCGGIANYFGVDSRLIRIIFVFTPASILFYLLLGYFLHEDNNLY